MRHQFHLRSRQANTMGVVGTIVVMPPLRNPSCAKFVDFVDFKDFAHHSSDQRSFVARQGIKKLDRETKDSNTTPNTDCASETVFHLRCGIHVLANVEVQRRP